VTQAKSQLAKVLTVDLFSGAFKHSRMPPSMNRIDQVGAITSNLCFAPSNQACVDFFAKTNQVAH
jgi:hypothetical protein